MKGLTMKYKGDFTSIAQARIRELRQNEIIRVNTGNRRKRQQSTRA